MIHIPQPSLALNQYTLGASDDENISYELHYRMQYNCVVNHSQNMPALRGTVLHFLSMVSAGRMNALVINAHGWTADGVYIGSGLNSATLQLFNQGDALRDKFTMIYLASCEVAGTTAGERFCRDLASSLNCYVVASETNQSASNADRTEFDPDSLSLRIPHYCIDEFEGTVYKWHPNGTRVPYSTTLTPFVPSSGGSCGTSSGRF